MTRQRPTQTVIPRLGQRISECPACGEFFSSTSTFDQHRAGDYGGGRYCLDPTDAGLVFNTERGFWAGPPMSDEMKEKLGR